jgi:uncharacterized protein
MAEPIWISGTIAQFIHDDQIAAHGGAYGLLNAIQFMKWFMVNSSKETQSTEAIGVERFRLSTETDDQPSFFEIVLLLDGQQHRYGFTADREKVVSEWLYYVPKTRETKLFDRQDGSFDIAKVYKADGIAAKTLNIFI